MGAIAVSPGGPSCVQEAHQATDQRQRFTSAVVVVVFGSVVSRAADKTDTQISSI